MGFLIVFLGGGIGAALRHGVNLAMARLVGTAFPYATLFENVTGSLVMGLLAAYFAFKGDASQHWLFRVPPRDRTAHAAVSHHRHSWRLHDILGLLT